MTSTLQSQEPTLLSSFDMTITQIESTYSTDGIHIHIFGRDKDKRAHHLRISGFRRYFWITYDKEIPEHCGIIEGKRKNKTVDGREVQEVYSLDKWVNIDVFNYFTHFEGDISAEKRLLIDLEIYGGIKVSYPLPPSPSTPSTPPKSLACDFHALTPASIAIKPRICTIDIETADDKGFPRPERDAILCITVHDSYDDKYTTFLVYGGDWVNFESIPPVSTGCFNPAQHTIQYCIDEKDLFSQFEAFIQKTDPDILTGWNFANFDASYILQRAKTLNIKTDFLSRLKGEIESNRPKIRGRIVFDLLAAYKKMQGGEKESYRLDAIASEELGEAKVTHKETITDLWEHNPVKLVEYNFKDVWLCVGIDKKNKILEFYQELARYTGVMLDSTLSSSHVVDMLVLRAAKGKFALPTKTQKKREKITEFEGAMVHNPTTGLVDNVIVLDLKSLYPMTMMTLNASIETKIKEGQTATKNTKAPNGVKFRQDIDGLTREILSKLLKERDERKTLMKKYPPDSYEHDILNMQQNAIKVIMNSYYGICGYPQFRLYDPDIAAAVTSTGRAIFEFTEQRIAEKGLEAIYGDTDSIFIRIPHASGTEEEVQAAVIAASEELETEMNRIYPQFAKDTLEAETSYFSTKFEKFYRRFFQGGAKKRYAGLIVWKEGQAVDKIDIAGYELKRSDFPKVTKEVERKVFDLVLRCESLETAKAALKDYLKGVITDYRSGRLAIMDVGIPNGLSKEFSEYKNNDIRKRAAMYSNQYLGAHYGKGSKPKRIHIKETTDPKRYPLTDVMCIEEVSELPAELVIDWDTMLDKTIRAPLSRIFAGLGWQWDEFDPAIAERQTTLF